MAEIDQLFWMLRVSSAGGGAESRREVSLGYRAPHFRWATTGFAVEVPTVRSPVSAQIRYFRATAAGTFSMSISVRKSIVLNSRSIAGSPQMRQPTIR